MDEETISLTDPDISRTELGMVEAVLCSPHLGQGRMVEAFEGEFSAWLGRQHAVAVSGSTLALWLCLAAWEIQADDEIITPAHSWHQIARGISLAGAKPVFADIDYWAGTLAPQKAAEKITSQTRAILAGNTNGHPADWRTLRALAQQHGLKLIEDCTESLGSRYAGQMVGTFGDCAIFDFSQLSALCCGEGAMIVTDDLDFARTLRYLRDRQPDQRYSISISRLLPLNARISDITAALGLAQLGRIGDILARRKQTALWYEDQIKSFEGIKPPYLAPDVDEVNWFLYTVHLGTRFSHSSCRSIVDDLHTAGIDAELYSYPLYLERYYIEQGWRKGSCFVTEKVADRAIALPFHAHLSEEQIKFIVKTAKDASINIGAGAAIYL
ncbi:MAG: DegT/DnrJ/EryC1/StrS family aminotransferase [Sideroxydans sp.]|nr:DegT/DnrJ/EryC1/StrS family aminotransferase [Sideroxydans sp.]